MKNKQKMRKKIAIRSVLILQVTGFFYDNIWHAWSYPLKEIAKPTCKSENWSKLSSDCKMQLPIIAKANYAAYKDNQTVRRIYSVLWGAPYSNGWDMSKGAHEGIDITSAEGTPIYAVEDWVVYRARDTAGYGKLVTLKHTLADKSVVYSIYGHVATYIVKEGDKVVEGQQIATMWHEGNSAGNHLHFAINKTPDNTYVFRGCMNYPKIGDEQIIENGYCRDQLFSRTVDPIAFIEYNGMIPTNIPQTVTTIINRNLTKPVKQTLIPIAPTVVETTVVTPVKPVVVTPVTPVVVAPIIKQVGTTLSSKNITSSEEFFKKYTISVTSNFGTNLTKGWSSTIGIVITDNNGKAFAWVLDKEISITPSKQNVALSPRVIRYVSEGKIVSIIEAKDTGASDIVLSFGGTVFVKIALKVD